MSKNNRDDFPEKTKDKLSKRVGLRCSNPDCRVPTSAPSNESDDAINNIGVAAHICAAASGKGARRYDSNMTPEQRKSFNNGIWLCDNCSTKIDKDETTYTVELLNEWKKQAEENARLEQGTKLPKKEDTIDTLKIALTGHPKKMLVDAIDNVHKASSQSLEMLDPRFNVKTFYHEDVTEFFVYPKETVPFKMNVQECHTIEFKKQFIDFINYGEDLKIDNKAINLQGLPIIEFLFSECTGTLTISPTSQRKRKCVMKLWFVEPETNKVETFDDIHGEIRDGNKGFTFKGSACDELFYINLKIDPLENSTTSNLSILFEKWNNTDINKLPYFNKILSFILKLVESWELNGCLEIDGDELGAFKRNKNGDDYISYYYPIKYIELCQQISKFTNTHILFSEDFDCSTKKYNHISEVVDIINGKIYKKDDGYSASFEWAVPENFESEDFFESLKNSSCLAFQWIEDCGETIELFNKKIEMPPKFIMIESVIAEIDKDISFLKAGDIVQVNLIPQENFSCKISYRK